MRLSLLLLLCCIAVARGDRNDGGDSDNAIEIESDRFFYTLEEGSASEYDIDYVTPVIATKAGDAALMFMTDSKHWAGTNTTVNNTFWHTVYLTKGACAANTADAQSSTKTSTESVRASDLTSEEFEVENLDAGTYNLCYSRNNSSNWVDTTLDVEVVDIDGISPDVVNAYQDVVVFDIEGISASDVITFTSGNCNDINITTASDSPNSTKAFTATVGGEISDGDFTGGALPGEYSLCFSFGGDEDFIDTGLDITISVLSISIGELAISVTETLQTITVVNDGVANITDEMYLTTGECAAVGPTDANVDTQVVSMTGSSGLQSAAFTNTGLVITLPTELKLCFSPSPDPVFYDSLYTLTAYPTRVMTVEPMEVDTNDFDLVMKFTLIDAIATLIGGNSDMVYFTKGGVCGVSVEANANITLDTNGEGRMDWSKEETGIYTVCFSPGDGTWLDTSIVVSHEEVTFDSIIMSIIPTLLTADMDLTVTLYGDLNSTDQFVFALDCDVAATTVVSSAGESTTETVNLPAGEYKLCYLESGYTDPIEQLNVTLIVGSTSPVVITDVSPVWVSAGVKTDLQFVGSPVAGDLFFFSSNCSEAWVGIDALSAENYLPTGEGGELELCYRSVGLKDSVVQTGVTLNVVALALASVSISTPNLVTVTLVNNGVSGTIYFTSNECMVTAPAADANNTVVYDLANGLVISVNRNGVDPGEFTLCFSPAGGNGYLETALEIVLVELSPTGLTLIKPSIIYNNVTVQIVELTDPTITVNTTYKMTVGVCSVAGIVFSPTVSGGLDIITVNAALVLQAISALTGSTQTTGTFIVCVSDDSGATYIDSGLELDVIAPPGSTLSPTSSPPTLAPSVNSTSPTMAPIATTSSPTVSPKTTSSPTEAPPIIFSAASRVTQKSLVALVTIVFGVLLL